MRDKPAPEPLPGYQQALPLVFAGLYPMRGDDYPLLRDALDKLHLNDASFVYEPESSVALGFGFRCGFLGLLHMEIVQERLEREFDLDLLASAPSVEYRVRLNIGPTSWSSTTRPRCPTAGEIEAISEPWVAAAGHHAHRLHRPDHGAGHHPARRVRQHGVPRPEARQHALRAAAGRADHRLLRPAQEPHQRATPASTTSTSATAPGDLVKLDVLVNGEPVDALSLIVHRSNAYRQGKALVEKLKELIPRQMFEVPVQAAIGSHIISRETIRAMRKNVLAKCYGGDITRKRKLLEKQKEGKQRMKRIGSVEIPQEAFLAVLRMNEA